MQVRRAAYIVLSIIGWAFRIAAVVVCLVTAALCFSRLSSMTLVAALATSLAYALPASVAGYGLVASPFGGVFRFDFACLALVLFLLDFGCSWLAAKLM